MFATGNREAGLKIFPRRLIVYQTLGKDHTNISDRKYCLFKELPPLFRPK